MIYQFPVPHDDELLGSVLARFISRQGIREDKVALELLFGSRNIVPSALLQGHLSQLLNQVQHLWPISADEVLAKHSILPIFEPYIEPGRYFSICSDLVVGAKSHSMLKVGINASSLILPTYYRFCPVCLSQDIQRYAYSYWRRQFQLTGMTVCPKHNCFLLSSEFELKPSRRHGFIDATVLAEKAMTPFSEICQKPNQVLLSRTIDQLFQHTFPYIAPEQWTLFYDLRLREVGLKNSKGADHSQIESLMIAYWGRSFLAECGLDVIGGVTWLQTFFRKQRKHFSYLHHLLCVQALFPGWQLHDVFKVAKTIKNEKNKRVYTSAKAELRAPEYRSMWCDLRIKYESLKEIRATKEGVRVYSWLYRFDNKWLKTNLPSPVRNNVGRVVNWKQRDFRLVRQLIKIRCSSEDDLLLPRMTQNWFISQLQVRWGIDKHLAKLPLCGRFFVKYVETVQEYQVRRVLAIIVDCINKGEPIPQAYEIERAAGLSEKRIREAPQRIIREDLEVVSSFKLPTKGQRAG